MSDTTSDPMPSGMPGAPADAAWVTRDPRLLSACLTVKELCAWLRIEKDYVVRKAVRDRALPHLRVGRQIRFAPEHVAAAVRFFEVAAVPAPRGEPVAVVAGLPGVSRRSRAARAGGDLG